MSSPDNNFAFAGRSSILESGEERRRCPACAEVPPPGVIFLGGDMNIETLAPDTSAALRTFWRGELGFDTELHLDTAPADRPNRTCIHEAGHAVTLYLLFGCDGLRMAFVCERGGMVMQDHLPWHDYDSWTPIRPRIGPCGMRHARHMIAQRALVLMAGLAAEAFFFGRPIDKCIADYAGNDLEEVDAIAREWKLKDLRRKSIARASALVRVATVLPAIIALAAVLKADGFADADRIKAVSDEFLSTKALRWGKSRFPKLEDEDGK